MLAPSTVSLLALGLIAGGLATRSVAPSSDAAEAAAIDRAYAAALERAARDVPTTDLRLPAVTWRAPRVVRSDHYEIRTTSGRGYALGLLRDLEQLFDQFQDVLGTDFTPRTPFPILVHPSLELYQEYGDAHSDGRSSIFGGYYDRNNPGGAVATLYDPNLTLERMFLAHGASQQYIDRAFPDAEKAAVLTQGLGAYFQASWAYSYFVDRFEALRDRTNGVGLIPLEELLSAPLTAYSERAEDRFFQLAMVFVYLRSIRADTKSTLGPGRRVESVGLFDDYLRRAVRGESLDDHPVHELLNEGLDVLEAEIIACRAWR